MHGEYKVPGGKLVVVDLDVEDGLLANVQLSGDFFLEPDAALTRINAALDGLAVNSSTGQLVAAIDEALGADVQMYGFSTEAVVEAVRRALQAGGQS